MRQIVYAEESFLVKGSEVKYIHLSWEGYGIQIDIPPGALKDGVSCTIALKAVHLKDYKIPQFQKYELVSAFYWVASSRKFLKSVDLKIKHCVHLKTDLDVAQMEVVSAKCNQEDLPYLFERRQSIFKLESRESQISTRHFSFFTNIWNLSCIAPSFRPHLPSSCYYAYMVFEQRSKLLAHRWLFDLYFLQDIRPLVMVSSTKCTFLLAESYF